MTHRPLKSTADGSLTAMILWVESDFALMIGPVDVHEYDVGTVCAKAGPARPARESQPQSAAARFARDFMENSLKRGGAVQEARSATSLLWRLCVVSV